MPRDKGCGGRAERGSGAQFACKLHRGLRVAWLVHTALYRPSTGEQKPDRKAWCDRQHIVLHSAHFGTLQRLTLWYEHDHTDVYGYRDKEGRWT